MTALPLETVIDKLTVKTTFGIAIEPINEGSKANITLFNRNQKYFTKHLFYPNQKLRVLGNRNEESIWTQSRKIILA
jgi:hypothetical protein